jgi:glycosyltransferase involved in cell wall biosynthesis
MKIALVHDYLSQDGGAERVLKAFHEIYPDAPIFVLFYDAEKMGHLFPEENIRTSFIQNLPFGITKYQWYLPLMPHATERHNLDDFDIVLSSTSAFAKGVITHHNSTHICYCHTPTRYLWTDTHSYVENLKYNRVIKKLILLYLNRLRSWDRISADRVDKFIANSNAVKHRIMKYYRRESDVIHPPVETNKFRISENIGNYYLAGGRLVPYKRFDILIHAFNRLNIPLRIFGQGPELEKLQKLAKSNIGFLGKVSEEERKELYSKCIAYLNPQEEDFGITAVEAMASGRPVIAYKKGGALESIVDGETGMFFNEQDWETLADTILRFKPENFDAQKIREHAKRFDIGGFKNKIKEYVENSNRP